MPKPIQLTVFAEEFALGKIFRTLDNMNGVVSIALHGAPAKGQRKAGPSAAGIILKELTTKIAGRDLLRSAIVAGGKAPTSLQSTIDGLRKRKLVQDIPNGKFKITQAGRKHLADANKGE